MRKRRYKPLSGESFHESFLMAVEQTDWPNGYNFAVWSPRDATCYRIAARNVLEYHFIRIGTGRLEGSHNGIPLEDIYITKGDDFDYWSERIRAFAEQGLDSGEPPVCVEFASHLFANRRKQLLTRDQDTGLLVVCREVHVEPIRSYDGPRPTAYGIPSDDPFRE